MGGRKKNQILVEMAITMFDEYKTSDRFWVEAVNTPLSSQALEEDIL
jgi:hypothetical protein